MLVRLLSENAHSPIEVTGVYYMYDSKSGFAFNISAAVDLGKGKHGCLLGIKNGT